MESLLTSGKAHRGTLVGTAGSSTGRSWRENAAGGESSRVSHLGDRPESELGDQDTNDSDEVLLMNNCLIEVIECFTCPGCVVK